MQASRARTERLWKDYLREPSDWLDSRKNKTNPKTPDFKHKIIEEWLWMDGCYNPSWVKDRLTLEESKEQGTHKAQAEEEAKHSTGGGWRMLSLDEALSPLEEGVLPQPSIEDIAHILHKCRKKTKRAHALRLHAYMHESGLEAHTSLGNYLVSMLVEVGSICNAQQVFDRLVYRSECSWNSLIIGYVKCGKPQHALTLYQRMQKDDSVHTNMHTFVVLLKACAELKDLERGIEMHAEVARMGLLERDVFVGNTLVNMYAKCGSLVKAQQAFDKLPVRDVVTWNALMAAYAKHGHGEKTLKCFEQMKLEDVSPDVVTFICCLSACGSIGAIDKGKEIHAEIERKRLLESDLVVGSTLVDMYCKCGSLAKAQQLFDKIPVRDVVSWTILLAGYTEHGQGEEALRCFEQMQLEGVSPDCVTLACILKACGSIGATDKGQEIHSEIEKKGLLERNLVVGNILVDMYAKCGLPANAQQVFNRLPIRDVVSWNALISEYAEHGHDEEALQCFEQMQLEGVPPDSVTFVCSLKACGSLGATDKGGEIHAEIERKGLLERDLVVGNTLVAMYARCGLLSKAQQVFDKLPIRDVVSWTVLISGYAECGYGEEALKCFEQMQLMGVSPDAVTLVCSLQACGSIGATDKGQELHAEIERKGLLERNIVVGNTLVDMYAKFGLLAEAQQLFEKLPVRDVVTWNALIVGYAEHGHGDEALMCSAQMQLEGVYRDAVTFICSLKACASMGATDTGGEIHAEIERKGLLERDLVVGNSLIAMYVKCGLLAKAHQLFEKLPVRDVISWTILIAGYAEHGHGEEALKCFEQMQLEGVSPDALTFVCSLKACGSTGATENGEEIHAEIERRGLLEGNLFVGSSLVHMYGKCGLLAKAQQVFDKLPDRDIVSWNALIAGYARLGGSENVFQMFERMQGEGIKPDLVTFIIVLNTCSRTGLFIKSQAYLEAMRKDYSIVPTLEHCTCMVDLLGRVGQLDKVVTMIKEMPFCPNLAVWHIVLGNCRNWGNVELGKQAFEYAVHVNEKDAAAFVLMSAGAIMQEGVNKIEAKQA